MQVYKDDIYVKGNNRYYVSV